MKTENQRAAAEALNNAGMKGASIATRAESINDTARLMGVLNVTHTNAAPAAPVSRPYAANTGKPT